MKIVAGLAVFKIGLGAVQFVLGGLLGPLASVIAFVRKLQVAGMVAAMLPKLAAGLRLAGIAFRFMLGPIGLVITALTIVGVAAYQNWDKIKAAFMAGKAWLSNFGSNMLAVGKQIVLGLARGIAGAHVAVWNALKRVVLGGIGKVKNLLGIKSPSRVFMQIGAHTGEGMAIGLDRTGRRVAGAAGKLAAGAVAAGSMAMASPAMASARPAAASAQAGAAAPITIHIHQQAGEDAQDLARRVASELQRDQARAQRSAYED